jgi:hypothetical protein
MVEILKPVKHKKLGIEAIHGHTCIELKDVRTGVRDRIESDNIVTDGAEYLLNMHGGMLYWNRATIGGSEVVPIAANLFGGLLLFNDTIPTSPTPAKFMPAGVKMVGNGSYKMSNSGIVTEMGSYNEPESVLTRNKFEQVYDFSTQQANGTIKSVCLTSRIGGWAGYGNSSSESFLDTNKAVITSYGNPMYYQTNWCGTRGYAFYDNKVVGTSGDVVPQNATSVTLNEYPVSHTLYDDFLAVPPVAATGSFGTPSDTYEVALPQYNNLRYLKARNSKIYISPSVGGGIANNASFTISVIDVSNRSVINKTLINSTGKTIRSAENSGVAFAPVADDILWACTSDKYIVVIDLTHETVALSNIQLAYNDITYIAEFAPGLIALSASSAPSAFTSVISLYDVTNSTIYPTNLTANPERHDSIYQYDAVTDMLKNAYQSNVRLMPHPWRLTTINNLGSAATKDATKTMKVTYTLTFS